MPWGCSSSFSITAADWHNNGLLVLAQAKRTSALANLGFPTGSIENQGSICLFGTAYQQLTSITGSGCISADRDSTIYIFSSLLPIATTQTLYLADRASSIVIQPVTLPATYTVRGFGNGNKVGISLPLLSVPLLGQPASYDPSSGVLTLRGLGVGLLSQRFQIGTGYDSSLFEIVTDDGAGLPTTLLGSVRYNGPVPNNAVPASCNCKCVTQEPTESSSLSSSTSEQSSSSATSVSASETSDTSSTQESSLSSEVSSTQEPSSSTPEPSSSSETSSLKSRHLLKVRRHLLIPQLLLLVNHQLHHHHLLRPLLPSLQLRNHHHLLRDLHLHKNHPQVKNHLLKNHHLLPKNHLLPKVHLPLKSHHLLKVHRHLLILQQILPQLLQQMNKAVLVLVNHPLKTNQLTLLSLILPVLPILVLLQTVVLLTPIPIVNPQTLLLQQIPALLIVILLQVPKLTQM